MTRSELPSVDAVGPQAAGKCMFVVPKTDATNTNQTSIPFVLDVVHLTSPRQCKGIDPTHSARLGVNVHVHVFTYSAVSGNGTCNSGKIKTIPHVHTCTYMSTNMRYVL